MSGVSVTGRDTTARSALVLGAALALALASLGALHALTETRVEAGRLARLDARLEAVLGTIAHDNEPARERVPIDGAAAGTDTVYRARLADRVVGAALHAVAPDGYSGPIELLVGVHADGRVAAVRVLDHRETPGLGDRIERRRSDWIETFSGRSLGDRPSAGVGERAATRWRVVPPGRGRPASGEFDALAGATITSRAVVEAVRDALLRFETHRTEVLAP